MFHSLRSGKSYLCAPFIFFEQCIFIAYQVKYFKSIFVVFVLIVSIMAYKLMKIRNEVS